MQRAAFVVGIEQRMMMGAFRSIAGHVRERMGRAGRARMAVVPRNNAGDLSEEEHPSDPGGDVSDNPKPAHNPPHLEQSWLVYSPIAKVQE